MKNFNVKIFADGAEKSGMLEMNQNSLISGLTTNPTLMKKAGIMDYRSFCKDILLRLSLYHLRFLLMIYRKWNAKH